MSVRHPVRDDRETPSFRERDSTDSDGVLINDTHDPHVMPALDAGIHVLLSFPIALARAEPPSVLGRNAAYSQI
jgi:hypothetical protein